MLFNSHEFLFFFLPATLLGFFILGRHSHLLAAGWLAMASLFFYGWWNPTYVVLLLLSITFNFLVGRSLANTALQERPRPWLLITGIAANLGLLAYYKYANFFVGNLSLVLGSPITPGEVLLPLGISFFTFTQIAFLVDSHRAIASEYRFIHYCLFVTYFPHLIAGPVLHHKEMMPQFASSEVCRPVWENFSVGSTIFAFGLFKKVVLADSIGEYVPAVFTAAAQAKEITFFDAWGGALAYTLQLYFDFSGYSDMAIGLSRLFGIRLPINFNSPYKAASIIDFWRRWHMTLSRFLRDYLYVAIGGNRRGAIRRYTNLLVTMLLGGLWHGAGWTFVIWGGLHGIYLLVNHAFRGLHIGRFGSQRAEKPFRVFGILLTFLCIVIGWVFFRAPTIDGAINILAAMAGSNGIPIPPGAYQLLPSTIRQAWLYPGSAGEYFHWPMQGLLIVGLLGIVCFLPNTQQIMSRFGPGLAEGAVESTGVCLTWRPGLVWLSVIILSYWISFAHLDRVSEFLYFQF